MPLALGACFELMTQPDLEMLARQLETGNIAARKIAPCVPSRSACRQGCSTDQKSVERQKRAGQIDGHFCPWS